jgi:endonuclease/exonuclease/phosphatase (EEP) superfamily protein YafD
MCLFGPRWIEFFPLAVLLPLAIAFSRKWIAALLGIALLIAVPIMDLRITRGGLFPPDRPSGSLRVLTLNTHFGYTDPVKFKALLAETQPDVIALQEWYPGNRDAIFGGASWNLIQSSEAITASRYPIAFDKMTTGMANISGGVTYHYTITLPNRNLSFFSVHLASPHSAFRGVLHRSRSGNRQLEANSRERLREARILNKYADDDTLLAGDFNLPRDSTIFRSCFARLSDAFTDAGLGYGLTYYSQWTTVRIDHILMGKNWRCTHCWVGPDVGSPHRPVIADLIYMQDRR